MAFIRTKQVEGREYRQLVENYRERGRHRQRVLAHLGKHDTLEEAIEAIEDKLSAWNQSKTVEQWEKAEEQARRWERALRRDYGEVIDRYHGGEIPTEEEVGALAHEVDAPKTEEVVRTTYYGGPVYAFQEVEVPDEAEEYRRAFGNVQEAKRVSSIGSRFHYGGLRPFKRWLRDYWHLRNRANEKHQAYEDRRQYLQARLEKLKAVVTTLDEGAGARRPRL